MLNHVLASEAVATERLRPHAGRAVALTLDQWPSLLPAPPSPLRRHHGEDRALGSACKSIGTIELGKRDAQSIRRRAALRSVV